MLTIPQKLFVLKVVFAHNFSKFLVIFLEFIFENKPFPSRKNLTLQSFYYIKDNVFVCLLLVEIQTME